ncbi:MAG: M20/M25/M40 family metallo-hydrolase [Bacteroidales bacterium]|nr:MAG: M20/M25/M40 family metallo-hydrolase [Bacteroidales bacterium]
MKHRYNTKSFGALILLVIIGSCSPVNIDNPEISIEELNQHIAFLASDSLKGRFPGTAEDSIAADYILNSFMDFGLQPLDSNGLQYFDVITSAIPGKNNVFQTDDITAELNKDFSPFSFSENDSLTADLVFAGYGFRIDREDLKWDDYVNLDITGKWVLLLRGDPEIENPDSPFITYSGDRDKAMQARDLGAGGVLFVSGVAYDPNDQLVETDSRQHSVGIPVFHITRELADQILRSDEETIEGLEEELNQKRQPAGFESVISLNGRSEIIQETVKTRNVVTLLQTGAPFPVNEYIVIGAHYDHLGSGGPGSTSRVQDSYGIHYGADDNASGIATLIELAEKYASIRDSLKRNILFVAFGAEEMGLLGSKHFTENPPVDPGHIKAMINIDMVGRLTSDRNLQIGGIGTSAEGRDILEKYSGGFPFQLAMSEEGYGPSDHASFYGIDIPVFFFSTGAHMDYHTPKDIIENINFNGLKSVSDYISLVAWDIANREINLTFREAGPKQGTQMRRRTGVTLGIMPDFAGNIKDGLRADFVIEGRPAHKGGMLKGDIIVSINGQPVKNIDDYMYRLSRLKFGDIINVEVRRGDKTEVLIIQL